MKIFKSKREITEMHNIGIYLELGFPNSPKMSDSFEDSKYENEKKIVNYLRSGEAVVASPKSEKDVYTGIVIKDEAVIRTDGMFQWPQCLAHYVENYHLRLPSEFEKHILESD